MFGSVTRRIFGAPAAAEPRLDDPNRPMPRRLQMLLELDEDLLDDRNPRAFEMPVGSNTRVVDRLPLLIAKADRTLDETMQMSPSTASRTKNLHGPSGM
jgi:hypothetical protein